MIFSIKKGVFGKLENRSGMIPGQKYNAQEVQVMEGSSTFCGQPISRIVWQQAVLNQSLEDWKKEWVMYASMPDTIISAICSAQRLVSDIEAVVIPRKISITPPQVPPTSRSKKAPLLCWLGEIGHDKDKRLWLEEPNREEEITL